MPRLSSVAGQAGDHMSLQHGALMAAFTEPISHRLGRALSAMLAPSIASAARALSLMLPTDSALTPSRLWQIETRARLAARYADSPTAVLGPDHTVWSDPCPN